MYGVNGAICLTVMRNTNLIYSYRKALQGLCFGKSVAHLQDGEGASNSVSYRIRKCMDYLSGVSEKDELFPQCSYPAHRYTLRTNDINPVMINRPGPVGPGRCVGLIRGRGRLSCFRC